MAGEKGLLAAAGVAAALSSFLAPGCLHAQAIQRNLPPAEQTQPQAIAGPNLVPSDQDDRPIGRTLTGLVVLGASDAPRTAAAAGVDTSLVARMNTPAAAAALQPFIGRPLSRKLIAEIEATIARYYRKAGYPFVALSTPPQSLGDGVLQVRVVEFSAGDVKVSGAGKRTAVHVRRSVRLQSGEPISAAALSEDLDWLNRYPFRRVDAVFSPGAALATTDLDLQTTETKPWQVYAGYANTGSPSTGWDRYFLGGQVGGVLGPDSVIGYQFTASPDFFDDDGRAFGDTSHPQYLSHGVRLAAPFAPRQEIEVSYDHVETNVASSPFEIRQIIDETSVGYRGALSNFSSNLLGDVTFGVEAKHEQRDTFFFGEDAQNGGVNVFQLYAGWSYAWSDPYGRSNVTVTLDDSPGGVIEDNSSAAFSTFTNGRVNASSYQYATLQAQRTTRLPQQWTLTNLLVLQYAPRALPDTEQLGVGGADLVRGYNPDDGAYDSAVVLRNELRAPPLVLSGLPSAIPSDAVPFAFVDVGYGVDRTVHKLARPASTGLGADIGIGPHLALSATAAYAVGAAPQTRAGDWRLETRLTATF